jgi:bacillithiol biosynthesis cysteine-adding enzyme BshC
MKLHYENYEDIPYFSQTDLAYIGHHPDLREFYAYEPTSESISDVVSARKQFPVNRELLWKTIEHQYSNLEVAVPVTKNIIADVNTFTVTTAHQPTLLTGPLYHIYKIANVIRLCRDLNTRYPHQKFIPVFVMSGEDHDWAEVNHFHLFGKRFEWRREAGGAVGHFNLSGLDELINEVNELFTHSPFGPYIQDILSACFERAINYGHFHRLLISKIFEGHGLVILNLDDPDLKRSFIPVFEKEIRERFSLHTVRPTQSELEHKGFKVQAYCRDLNLFYMTKGVRERIDLSGNGFVRHDTGIIYTTDSLIEELHAQPESFSPNVILRPLYQEFILPNIAYIGGGGEIAYWLERKAQFKEAGVHYPMLIRRNSWHMLDSSTFHQMEKMGFTWKDMLHDVNAIVRYYLRKNSQSTIDFEEEIQLVRQAFSQLAGKAEKLDQTLSKAIQAEEVKQIKVFEHLGSRLLRSEKQLQDTQIRKIHKLKEKLFPANGLQERHENFLGYYAQYGPEWISDVIEGSDPFAEKFILAELQE